MKLFIPALLIIVLACNNKKRETSPLEKQVKHNYRSEVVYSNDSCTIKRYEMDGDSIIAMYGAAAPPEVWERAAASRKKREALQRKQQK